VGLQKREGESAVSAFGEAGLWRVAVRSRGLERGGLRGEQVPELRASRGCDGDCALLDRAGVAPPRAARLDVGACSVARERRIDQRGSVAR